MKLSSRALRLELALAIGLLISFFASAAAQQQSLAKDLVRLHITAPSDSDEDQELKLAVRDRLLSDFFGDGLPKSADEAYAYLSASLPVLEALAKDELEKNGRSDISVKAELKEELFPARSYDGFSLPAGEYTSMRITLGEGEGKNWWCVMFPPLCTSLASGGSLKAVSGFSDGQVKLVTDDSAGVKVKFKFLEVIAFFKRLF